MVHMSPILHCCVLQCAVFAQYYFVFTAQYDSSDQIGFSAKILCSTSIIVLPMIGLARGWFDSVEQHQACLRPVYLVARLKVSFNQYRETVIICGFVILFLLSIL